MFSQIRNWNDVFQVNYFTLWIQIGILQIYYFQVANSTKKSKIWVSPINSLIYWYTLLILLISLISSSIIINIDHDFEDCVVNEYAITRWLWLWCCVRSYLVLLKKWYPKKKMLKSILYVHVMNHRPFLGRIYEIDKKYITIFFTRQSW